MEFRKIDRHIIGHPDKILYPHQDQAAKHLLENLCAGLLMEMSLGKTISTLTAVEELIYGELAIMNVLVVAPKRVIESVWPAEIKKWTHTKKLTISSITGTPKQRKAAVAKRADIYLVSRDNISWLIAYCGGSMLPYDMLILDESSSFKNPKSQRSKALKRVLDSFKRRVILTGTPAPNTLIDLWFQIYVLDFGERLGAHITKFRLKYFKPGMSNGHIVYSYNPLTGAKEMIYDKIKDICISMKTNDVIDLPDVIYNTIHIDFDDKTQAKYDAFEKESVLLMQEGILEATSKKYPELSDDEVLELVAEGGGVISAVNGAGLSNKLLQFANGAVYDEEKNWHEIHDLKIKALLETIEGSTGNIIIAYSYKHDLERILRATKKYNPVKLSGDRDVVAWNEGKIKLLLMHPASGGHGLNMQFGGHTIIWFGLPWSLELYQQLNARLPRPGQENKVIINRIAVNKTLDIRVLKTLAKKGASQESLMQAVKATIQKYVKQR